jgi:hypothetical protein
MCGDTSCYWLVSGMEGEPWSERSQFNGDDVSSCHLMQHTDTIWTTHILVRRNVMVMAFDQPTSNITDRGYASNNNGSWTCSSYAIITNIAVGDT